MSGFEELSRREVLKGGSVMTAAAGSGAPAIHPKGRAMVLKASNSVELIINGKRHRLRLDPRATLLDALREEVGLTGTKKGCDHGQCGACTVHIDGQPALSCLTLAASVDGKITTIEGLGGAGQLHPMQQAFIDHDAFQCGYCTPGQIMSAVALAESHGPLDAGRVREEMSGNLCRCAAYPQIVAAVLDGAQRMKGRRT